MEYVDSKIHLLKKPPLHQKRKTLPAKQPEGSKRAKRERPDGEVVRRSERLLAAKLRELLADSHACDHEQQLKTRKRRKRKNSSKQAQ